MSSTPDSIPMVFRTRRVLAHPPAAVYAAFAEADRLARWWGPRGFTNRFDTFEFRTGGRWEFVMQGPDGTRYPNVSVFRELVVAERLVIEHVSPPQFTLTVTLAPDAAGEGSTLLSWAQAFPDPTLGARLRAIVEPANEENLDRLSAELAGTNVRDA
jgi:uncharacterized protein YndB with AHSA1/START domain